MYIYVERERKREGEMATSNLLSLSSRNINTNIQEEINFHIWV